MVRLNSNVRSVVMQFSFSNSKVVPFPIKQINRETQKESMGRKNQFSGIMLINPTEKCSLTRFTEEIQTAGYQMIDAFYQTRINSNDPCKKRICHMVRFVFAGHEFVELSDEFRKTRHIIHTELKNICENAMWRVRLFSNPFYKNGKEVFDQSVISINLEARQPFLHPDGQTITMWQKDENGRRVGDAPLPIKADFHLRIMKDSTIRLMAV